MCIYWYTCTCLPECAVLDENKETPLAISSYERFTCLNKKKNEGCRIVVVRSLKLKALF